MSVSKFSYKEIEEISNNIENYINDGYFDDLVEDVLETKIAEKKFFPPNTDNNEKAIELIQRGLWYGYIANKTAWEMQYQENTDIDFKAEEVKKEDAEVLDLEYIKAEVSSLIYNIYTNDGNCFLQDDWVEVIKTVEKNINDRIKY
tara:strand:+ start:644 stop:1081 length:438 start_codon:yes stop_codon:yes gene_type:complete